MKSVSLVLSLLFTASFAHAAKIETGSVYTNLKTDCVTVSSSNANSEIDFSDAECKAFGGYELHNGGGDLRYGPQLKYAGQDISVSDVYSFHDMPSDKVEWLYQRSTEKDGTGTLEWKAFIYRLSFQDEDGSGTDMKEKQTLLVVRLDGAKSCFLGRAATNEAARALALNPSAPCSTGI